MVVCCYCGRRFHVECLGVREKQRVWKCFECLIEYGNRLRRAAIGGGSGLLDMNASPPRESEGVEEGYFVNSELVLAASFSKMQDLTCNPFVGFALSSPSQDAASSMPQFANRNLETPTRRGNLVYLQALKDYISEKQGVLGDGWRVKFEYSESNCKTSAIYLAPDGSRFHSMSQVAQYLGLISAYNAFETEDKGNSVILLQKGSNSSRRKKDKKANKLREHENGRNSIEVDSSLNGSKSFHNGFPVQFEDFFVMSVGKIDPRASFHSAFQIWPVGYQSIWHDKFTGSVFIYDVLDGGESGPVFRVRRYSCTNRSIPYASKVLCTTKCEPVHDDHEDDTNTHIMFAEPFENDYKITSCLTSETVINLEEPQTVTVDHDFLGEFLVEDMSLSSAWKTAVETLLHMYREAYTNKKMLTFCCNHRVSELYVDASYSFDSLGKFCYLTSPINSIPDKILTVKELESSCEVLRKWLELDRCGLDVEFVQELIEHLPGAATCSKYKSLTERSQSLSSKTVASGFFTVISKDGLQNEAVSNSLRQTNKRPSPPGNKVNSNLPPHLIGDVIQAYEICLRFYNVLGLDSPISRQVMENELMNPWVDDLRPVKRSSIAFQKNPIVKACDNTRPDDVAREDSVEEHEQDSSQTEAASRCTGAEMAKFHMAILKVVIEDVLAKVKEIFDPFGGVESKSRKGRKKDVEFAVGSEKINLDMFPVNEFTWPEVSRRYILGLLSVDGNLESSEAMTRECGKLFHCLYGDGGTLCGSLTGVAAMEADAMVLAEASKKIFSSVKGKSVDLIIDQKEMDIGDSAKETNAIDDDSPEWAQALEPVRKLPTNVGARIRRCIYDSLNRNPPDWAKEILEHSISKEVYKGNASGPTKRAVISVLEKVRADVPQPKPTEKKEKEKEKTTVRTISDAVTKRCRVVLRSVAAADEDRVFFNLLARPILKPNDSDDTGLLGYNAMVSRPLDFRTIDLRLAAGFYVTSQSSHESFIEDVREVWQNLRIAYRDRPDHIELVETLSKKFEESYENEVLNLVSKISNSVESSTEEGKKELNSLVIEIIEGPLPPAPWEDGVCKVCGMDKDDDSVLLCDKCDSEYHTYCLDPPLARIPDGNWYCPSCMSTQRIPQDEPCGTRALSRLHGKKKFRKEFTRNLLEKLAPLADTMELMEYWELGIEERVFLFKLLCDEVLNSVVVRNHLCPDSGDLEKTLRKLNKELKSQHKKEEYLTSNLLKDPEDKSQEDDYLSFSKSGDGQSEIQNEDGDENKNAGQDQESLAEVRSMISSLQEKISTLESKIAKPVIRREYLGRDLVGRLYWALSSPERVLASGPPRKKACEMPNMYTSDDSLWTCYESDTEIQELIGWLRDDDVREKDLKETIIHWRANRGNGDNTPQIVEGSLSTSSGYNTKARAVLEKKFGSSLKKHGRKGKMVNKGNWYRCECLEIAGSTRHHCSSCHLTFLTYEELESHNDGKCGNHQETEQPRKKVPLVKHIDLTDCQDEPEPESDSPFVFEEIRAKFCMRGSLKEVIKDIGLIGSNGIPSFVWFNSHDGSTDGQPPEKQRTNETLSKVERLKPKGISGKSLLKTRTPVRISQSSLKMLTGRVLEILRHLKINLLDMETALPKEALRPSRGGVDRLQAWRAFVKSAQSIYEMVQATVMLEDMIKTEYLRKEWWFWSSPATAAKISNISALALRIYSLDAAIYYEKPTASNVEPAEPVTPKLSKSEKKNSEKSNMKESSEKSNPKNSSSVTDSKPTSEGSRLKTRSKKRGRDSDS